MSCCCDNEDLIQFINCRLVKDHSLVREDLWVRGGKIIDPEPIFFDEQKTAHKRFDCQNAILAPGYIDLQINGAFGVDFSDACDNLEEGFKKVSAGLVNHGVTSFCPTLVTSPCEVYQKVLPQLAKKMCTQGATILGAHLEGPFINVEKKGAHPEEHIREIKKGYEDLEEVYGCLEGVKIITMAPEKDASDGEVIRRLTRNGICVALGHSMADLKTGECAVKCGAALVTHLFNAMLPFHHRDPGLVGLLASDCLPPKKHIYFGIIADGIHTHPAALRIAYRTNPKGLILVTDAIGAMGLEDGTHNLGQMKVQVYEGKAFVEDTDTLAGSITPMDECVRRFRKATNCSISFAIEAATLHPARCLKMEKQKGTLDFGADADLIMLDNDLHVLSTWVNGEQMYKCRCCCGGK